jgi:hypothetical protein
MKHMREAPFVFPQTGQFGFSTMQRADENITGSTGVGKSNFRWRLGRGFGQAAFAHNAADEDMAPVAKPRSA